MENLKELRTIKRLTQSEVAKYCGVSLLTVQMWENCGTTPKPENLKKLEKLLME